MVRVYYDKCREDCTDDAITLDAKYSGQFRTVWGRKSVRHAQGRRAACGRGGSTRRLHQAGESANAP